MTRLHMAIVSVKIPFCTRLGPNTVKLHNYKNKENLLLVPDKSHYSISCKSQVGPQVCKSRLTCVFEFGF